jgi:hypothetical protein
MFGMKKNKKKEKDKAYEEFVKELMHSKKNNLDAPEKPVELKGRFVPRFENEDKNSLKNLLVKKDIMEDREPNKKMSSNKKIDFEKERDQEIEKQEKTQEKKSFDKSVKGKEKSNITTESILAINKQEQSLMNQLKKEINGEAVNKKDRPDIDYDKRSRELDQQEKMLAQEIRFRIFEPPKDFPSIHEDKKPKLKKAAGMYLAGMFL